MKAYIITKSYMINQALQHLLEKCFDNIEISINNQLPQSHTFIEDYNIVLIEYDGTNQQDLEILCKTRKDNNKLKLLVMDSSINKKLCTKIIKMGIDGYVTDFTSQEEFVYIINKILSGHKFFDSEAIQNAIENKTINKPQELTNRENEVMNLVAEGLSNIEIAKRLNVSENTIKKHVSNILEKLKVRNRQDIILYVKDIFKVG